MVGKAVCVQGIDCRFERSHVGDQLRILGRLAGKADNADPAAIADLAVFFTVGGLVDDVDEFLCAVFQVGQRTPRHAPRAIQNQHDIRRIG